MGEFGEIISALKPSAGGLGWSITLYTLFFLNIILLLMEGTSFGTNIGIVVLLCLFIDKTFAFGHMFNPNDTYFDNVTLNICSVFAGCH